MGRTGSDRRGELQLEADEAGVLACRSGSREPGPGRPLWRVTAPGLCRLTASEQEVLALLESQPRARLAFLAAGGWNEVAPLPGSFHRHACVSEGA
ncbi:hypothetical protein [Marinimicrococcus flavescens]|uniref:Uncharacterized protein n=1 Tax=Marinimicrococcus flavescens TaxID=3031815 RepID=A0AAP3XQW3_9PROT|nr:hypothetical protein [Marinimicrococcus flavescens]